MVDLSLVLTHSDPVDVQGPPGDATMVGERRRSPRTHREATGWLSQPFGKRTGGRPVRVYDLSLHGVGFISEIEHEIGREHWIVVSDNTLRLSTRCRLVSCRKNDLGTYQCGAEFF